MFRKVYRFTNENIASFNNLYNFDDAKVLSVLGSGDQYFTSLLNGASDVELFDINKLAWDYFILKYYGIMVLSYEEFINYFAVNKLDDYQCFGKLKKYLPFSIFNKFENLYSKNGKLSWIFEDNIFDDSEFYNFVPYLYEDKYYKLQSILLNRKIPVFYLKDFSCLSNTLSNKNYDVIMASNIFYRLYSLDEVNRIKLFRELLNKYNYSEFQAIYSWWLDSDVMEELEKNNFDIQPVPSLKKLKFTDDYVISLRK